METSSRKSKEKRLQDAVEELNLALDAGKAGIWDWDIANDEYRWSSRFLDIFGMDPKTPPSFESWLAVVHPDDRLIASRKIQDSIDNRTELDNEYRIILPSRELRWIRATGKTYYEAGRPVRMIGLCTDISPVKRSEEAFRSSEARFHAIAANTPDHIFIQDAELRYTFVLNPQMGLTEEDMVGKIDHDFLKKEDADKLTSIKRGVLETGSAHHLETSLVNKAGGIEYFNGSYIPLTDGSGKANGLIGYFRNVTGQRVAEEDLHRMSEILSEGQRIAHQGSFEYIVATRETVWSEEEFRIYGLDPGPVSPPYEEMLKYNIHPDDADALNSAFGEALREGRAYELEHRIVRPDGSVRIVYDLAHPYFDAAGKLVKYIGTTLDVTERKKAEEAMQRAQRLESLGLLAGGIAHDFNNLMGGVFGYVDMASRESDPEKASSYLAKALAAIDRARALSGQLLTFAKGGAPSRKVGPLFPFVRDTALFALSGSNASCRFQVPEGLWPCNFDRNQIGQVIENLVINAQQAMPSGGTIDISARNVELAEGARSGLPEGRYVEISMRDQGVGISGEQLPRVFDPFFTTKAKGHGLGLATAYSIIKRHGGCIEAESALGSGSVFRVYLPAARDASEAPSAAAAAEHAGRGAFLVMDDEEVMRETLSAMLASLGYRVECRDNGRETIEYFLAERSAGRSVAGMIVDLTVRGETGGREVAKEIRKWDAELPIFVASGYAEDPIIKDPAEFGFTASIRKPFRKSELSEMLNAHMKPRPE